MKKIFVSFGLAASAAGLSSALAQGMEAASPKLWNVSGTLRGFYDDNYNSSNVKKGSGGFEVSPTISGNVDMQQTDFGARYTFGMYYYFDRENHGADPIDYTHQADVWLDHAFDETLKLNLSDSLVIAQDPKLVEGGSVTRVSGNNVANRAKLALTKEWTRQFSTATHYGNNVIIYDDTGTTNAPGVNPSQSALLNRFEQNIGTDFQWQFQPETMGFIGYNFSWVDYTGDKVISPQAVINAKIVNYYSSSRNNRAHYGYVGAEHQFSPNLSATARAGASYTDVYNDPVSSSASVAPYVDINATYTFTPGSYVQAGFTQDQNATDVVAPDASGQLTQYQKSSVFYMDVTHQFDSKITGNLIGQYIHSTYQQGAYSNGTGDSTVSLGANLHYQINQHFSAELGYNFDELFSTIDSRGYSRNRVYIGLGANY